jgi:hypothetical protein
LLGMSAQRLIVSCVRFGKLPSNGGEEHFSVRRYGKASVSEPLTIGTIQHRAILRWTWWPIVETQWPAITFTAWY